MMTDFVKFKDSMLDNKRAFGSTGKQDTRDEGWNQMMKTGGMDWYERFKGEDATDPASGWNKVITFNSKGGNLEGTVYGKKVENFRTDWSKVESIYKDISLEDWRKCYNDWEGLLREDPQYKEVKVVERHPNGEVKVFYLKVGLGMFMTDRDVLVETKNTNHADGTWTTVMQSTQHPDYPENDETIRVSSFTVTDMRPTADGKGSIMTEHSNSDGMGWVPPSLMNMTMGTTTK